MRKESFIKYFAKIIALYIQSTKRKETHLESSSEPSSSMTSSHLYNYWDLYFGTLFSILAITSHLACNQDMATLFSALAIG